MSVSRVGCGLALAAALRVASWSGWAAGEEAPAKEKPTTVTKTMTVVVSSEGGSHWLGIMAIPVDEGLQSHLKVGERLIVQHTMPDSPAAKAGVRQYDILLKLGDAEIHSLQDLVQAVAKNEDKEAKLTVLRAGQEQSVTIKPEKRPAETPSVTVIPEVRLLEDKVSRWLQEKGGVWRPDQAMRMRFFGPGFLHSGGKFPSELSISIAKEGDKPAQITVRRKDEKWEVTEETLDKLPDDVRPHVEHWLGRSSVRVEIGRGTVDVPPKTSIHVGTPDVRKSLEIRRKVEGAAGLEELRKQMEELRQEVRQLKERSRESQAEKQPHE